MSDILYIVMPAYNEEANIEEVVRGWRKNLDGKSEESRLVVADNGSSDRTHEILENLSAELGQIEILTDSDRYHGPKLIALYRYAIEKGADWIFQTDSDGQTDPQEFKLFWDHRSKYDVLLGNRKERGDGKARKTVENVVCFMLWLYYGVKLKDANTPFRLMRAEALAKYIYRIPEDYFLPNIILSAFFAAKRNRIVYHDVTFKARSAGENSIDIMKIFKIGCKSLVDFARFRKDITGKE